MGKILETWSNSPNSTLSRTQIPFISLQATDFLFQVFAAAVVSWGDHFMPLLLGIRSQWFPWQPGSKPQTLQHALYGEESFTDRALPQCLLGMSHSLTLLLDKEPWGSQTHKVSVMYWIFILKRSDLVMGQFVRAGQNDECVLCFSVHRLAFQHHRRS